MKKKNNQRLRPLHYGRGIWKHNFLSTVRPTVHTNPSRKRSFPKTLLKPKIFDNTGCGFRCGQKHFENRGFPKRWRHNNHVISLTEFSSNTNPKWPLIVTWFHSFGVLWTENIWFVLGVKPPFSISFGIARRGPDMHFILWNSFHPSVLVGVCGLRRRKRLWSLQHLLFYLHFNSLVHG